MPVCAPAVALARGEACCCLGHGISNVLRQRLSGVTNAQADDLRIWMRLLVRAATTGNLHAHAQATNLVVVRRRRMRVCMVMINPTSIAALRNPT